MAKAAYIGVNGVARKVKKIFVGVPTRIGALKYLDHIESSGTQYIDTGYRAVSENYRIKCKFTVITNTANTVLFGGGGSSDIISVLMTADSQLKFYVGDGSVSDALSPFESGVEYEMECHASNGTLTVNLNGVSRSGSYSGTINKDYPLFIFANNASGSANQMSGIRVSEFQIYDNDVLVRDYVSCENTDGRIGLDDKANSQFYGNAGTGVFTAGSVVEEIGGETVEVARKVKKAWVGVNGVARLFYNSEVAAPTYDGSYSIAVIGDYTYMYLLDSGTLTINDTAEYDLFGVGGGGGSDYGSSGGGAGGYTASALAQKLTAGEQITVTIGAGGQGTTSTSGTPTAGGSTTIDASTTLTANGGNSSTGRNGADGGSGGGGNGSDNSDDGNHKRGGDGGSDGSDGKEITASYGSFGKAGKGQGTTTRAFEENDNTLYGGGGGGGAPISVSSRSAGGDGGGGAGACKNTAAAAGTDNTGGGAGGTSSSGSIKNGKNGGSGIAIIRWKT